MDKITILIPATVYDVFVWSGRTSKDLNMDCSLWWQLVTDPQASTAAATFLKENRMFLAKVLQNEELQTGDTGRSTRHLEIELVNGMSYTAGDHLGVMMPNPHKVVMAYMD